MFYSSTSSIDPCESDGRSIKFSISAVLGLLLLFLPNLIAMIMPIIMSITLTLTVNVIINFCLVEKTILPGTNSWVGEVGGSASFEFSGMESSSFETENVTKSDKNPKIINKKYSEKV